jgi:phosphopantothenoylcysteine synthetase/decarboxylase
VSTLKNKNIVLGITGSIAAYKAPELVRLLKKEQANISCVLTENGARFVTALTLQTVSCSRVFQGMFDAADWDIEHIALSSKADIIVVAPASADMIACLACGRADDLLSSVVLASHAPVLICPAMNDRMWQHAATKANVEKLKNYGYKFVPPAKGELACGSEGEGRLASLVDIVAKITEFLQ